MRVLPRYAVVVAVFLLIGCQDAQKHIDSVKSAETLAGRFPKRPEPGKLVAYPPVPLSPSSEATDARNLLSDPSFEVGLAYWEVSAPNAAECYSFDAFCADGQTCCHLYSPTPGEILVSQVVPVSPTTFYSFSALVFALGGSTAVLQVQDVAGGTVVTGRPARGPMNTWTKIFLTFVTGRVTEKIRIGVNCADSANGGPVLLDQCMLRMLPTVNLLPSGTMEIPPESDQMPEWYVCGKAALRVSPGFRSEYALELPALRNQSSSLYGLVLAHKSMAGRTVWVSAMVNMPPQKASPGPEVTLTLRLADQNGEYTKFSTTCPATGEWEETTLLAKVPDYGTAEPSDLPLFQTLIVERAPGFEGHVLVDEVAIFAVPEDGFDGGLVPADPLP